MYSSKQALVIRVFSPKVVAALDSEFLTILFCLDYFAGFVKACPSLCLSRYCDLPFRSEERRVGKECPV